MKIRVLRSALEDLARSRQFYDQHAPGIGNYFFDSLFSEIDSLALFAGIHRKHLGFHRMLARRFPFAVYYRMSGEDFGSWIADATPIGFEALYENRADLKTLPRPSSTPLRHVHSS